MFKKTKQAFKAVSFFLITAWLFVGAVFAGLYLVWIYPEELFLLSLIVGIVGWYIVNGIVLFILLQIANFIRWLPNW